MLKAYKYRLYPTEGQQQTLAVYFGCCRFVYNLALEVKKQAWAIAKKNYTWIDLSYQLTDLKHTDATWLQECPAQAMLYSLKNLDSSYSTFFRGGGYPKFKHKHGRQSIQFPQDVSVSFEEGFINLPKLKKVPCIFSRMFSGKIKTVTVSKTITGKYFVSILVDNQIQLPKKKPVIVKTTIGIDMGVTTFATLSNGEVFENQRFLKRNLSKLRVENRTLKRRLKRGSKVQSKGYEKQKLIVAKLYERIRNQREDFLQKSSTAIIKSHNTICIEDLNISGMMKNRKLSLAIGDLGWSAFKTMLEYKADWYGKNVLFIGRFDPSTKTCSKCGKIKNMDLSDRIYNCECGLTMNRDLNAAINIKNFGLRKEPSIVNVSH